MKTQTTEAHARYTVQNESALLDPNTGKPITGSRIYNGDYVMGEWYDTGNEIAAPLIVDALNQHQKLTEENARLREALEMAIAQLVECGDQIHGQVDANTAEVIEQARAALAQTGGGL
jgi:hypothetical protein